MGLVKFGVSEGGRGGTGASHTYAAGVQRDLTSLRCRGANCRLGEPLRRSGSRREPPRFHFQWGKLGNIISSHGLVGNHGVASSKMDGDTEGQTSLFSPF